MLKVNNRIKIKFFDYLSKKEIKTRIRDKVFVVREKNGKLGVDYNTESKQATSNGDEFVPFESFASAVVFENVDTGEQYHYSNITRKIEEVRK